MRWTWRWVFYDTGTSWGDNATFDWLRAVCVVMAILMMMAIGRIIMEERLRHARMPMTQRLRFVSLALAGISLAMTEISVAGTPATPRLFVTVVVLTTGTVGVWGMRHKQRGHRLIRFKRVSGNRIRA